MLGWKENHHVSLEVFCLSLGGGWVVKRPIPLSGGTAMTGQPNMSPTYYVELITRISIACIIQLSGVEKVNMPLTNEH